MSEGTKNPVEGPAAQSVAGPPPAPYTGPVGGDRNGARGAWWREGARSWIPMLAIGVTLLVSIQSQMLGMQRQVGELRVEFRDILRAELTPVRRELEDVQHRLTQVEGQLTRVEGQLTRVEGRLTRVEDRLTRVEGRLTQVEGRLTQVEDRLTRVEGRVTRIESLVEDGLPTPAKSGSPSGFGVGQAAGAN